MPVLVALETIAWHQTDQLISNAEVRALFEQPPLTSTIQAWHLSLFGDITQFDDNAVPKS